MNYEPGKTPEGMQRKPGVDVGCGDPSCASCYAPAREPLKCRNCGKPVAEANPGCVLHDLIQVVRERENPGVTEQQLQLTHAAIDPDGFWLDIGKLVDRLEDDARKGLALFGSLAIGAQFFHPDSGEEYEKANNAQAHWIGDGDHRELGALEGFDPDDEVETIEHREWRTPT